MTMPVFDFDAVLVLGLGAAFGAVGGFARYLVIREDALRTIVTGLVAAFAAIFVARPTDWVGLVTGAAAAGYASDAVLAGFVSRTKLATAKAVAEQAKAEAKEANAGHVAAESDLGKAIGALKSMSGLESLGMAGQAPAAFQNPAEIAAELEAAQNKRIPSIQRSRVRPT